MPVITDIERGLIVRYLTRLFIRQDLTLRSARNLLVWLNERSDVLSLPLPPALVEALGTRSWEITQVNEMLTWMEDHPLPVCFTTNFMERVDSASLRRFTFQIVLNYLDKPGLRRA